MSRFVLTTETTQTRYYLRTQSAPPPCEPRLPLRITPRPSVQAEASFSVVVVVVVVIVVGVVVVVVVVAVVAAIGIVIGRAIVVVIAKFWGHGLGLRVWAQG